MLYLNPIDLNCYVTCAGNLSSSLGRYSTNRFFSFECYCRLQDIEVIDNEGNFVRNANMWTHAVINFFWICTFQSNVNERNGPHLCPLVSCFLHNVAVRFQSQVRWGRIRGERGRIGTVSAHVKICLTYSHSSKRSAPNFRHPGLVLRTYYYKLISSPRIQNKHTI